MTSTRISFDPHNISSVVYKENQIDIFSCDGVNVLKIEIW